MLSGLGIETGLDEAKLLNISQYITGVLNIKSPSKASRALLNKKKKFADEQGRTSKNPAPTPLLLH